MAILPESVDLSVPADEVVWGALNEVGPMQRYPEISRSWTLSAVESILR